MPETKASQLAIFGNLFSIYIIWGSTYLFAHYAIEVLPPIMVAAIRFTLAGVLLFLFSLLIVKGLPTWQETKSAIIIGVLLTGFGTTAVAYGIKFMPTGLVALLVATLPLWVVMLDYLFFSKSKPNNLTLVGLLTGVLGMGVLVNPFDGLNTNELPLFPVLVVLLGTISWAYGSLLSPQYQLPNQLQSTAIQLLAGGIVAIILTFIFEYNQFYRLQNMTLNTYLSFGYLIFIGSFIGYSSFTWLAQNASPALVATYAYINPVVAMLLGWAFIGENLSNKTLTASAAVLFGVVLITLGRKR